jgi:hypothetical protein
MASPERRTIPDNLDPLVDTLSNVVGILVIVVALMQLQLGDALTRVVELERIRIERERDHAFSPTGAKGRAQRRDVLLRRTEADVEESIRIATATLAQLGALTPSEGRDDLEPIEELENRLDALQVSLAESKRARDRRARHESRLQKVPKRMVARLPDPQVLHGKESWILVRHGRVYLADREALLREGSRAIGLILQDPVHRRVREDEFDSVARYLRKRNVGHGNFRWQLETEPDVRVQLAWRSQDAGLEHADLAASRALREWLAVRSPDIDFIRFQIWGDSFEAYLAAREAITAAGFRAGWRGYEIDQEFDLGLRFGPPDPTTGPVEVD